MNTQQALLGYDQLQEEVEEVILEFTGVIGNNGFLQIQTQICLFVLENFDLLYEGAVRLGLNIGADYYAPKRIQIDKTRLHKHHGLKYCYGWKYNSDGCPSAEQLRECIKSIQTLISAAQADIPAPFILTITKV